MSFRATPGSEAPTGEAHAVGVDIGGTTTKIAAVSQSGAIQAIETLPTSAEGGTDAFLSRIFERVECVRHAHGALAGVGIGVAGFVDAGECMFYNPNLPWLQDVPLRRIAAERLDLPVYLDADSNAACLAEYVWGAGRGAQRFLCITAGTGVGGGMIVDGEIVRLAHGGLGDIGHVIVEPGGAECSAGCHGCAEAEVSAPAIEARAPGLTLRDVITGAQRGDAHLRRILADAGRKLGIALASQAVITFPDRIAIAGGLAEAGDLVVRPAAEAFEHTAGRFYRSGLTIVRGELGWRATVAGAAALAFPCSRK